MPTGYTDQDRDTRWMSAVSRPDPCNSGSQALKILSRHSLDLGMSEWVSLAHLDLALRVTRSGRRRPCSLSATQRSRDPRVRAWRRLRSLACFKLGELPQALGATLPRFVCGAGRWRPPARFPRHAPPPSLVRYGARGYACSIPI